MFRGAVVPWCLFETRPLGGDGVQLCHIQKGGSLGWLCVAMDYNWGDPKKNSLLTSRMM
jgi:hypothetical protein